MWRRAACIVVGSLAVAATASAGVSFGMHLWVPPCTAIGCGWWGAPAAWSQPMDPELAVVKTAIRPKHTRLYLDGTFIGLAADFDGSPDYLYLERGRYQLAAELGGYENHVVEIDARRGRAYEIKVRMQRTGGQAKEGWWDRPDRPDPLPRVYGKQAPSTTELPPPMAAPDPALRPDLYPGESPPASAGQQPGSGGSAVRFKVLPGSASVYLDGEFVATGDELNRMVLPLAIGPGRHTVVVMAPGHATQTLVIDTTSEPLELMEIVLEPEGPGVDNS